MSMYRNMRALKEVGYPHMVVPDHAPVHADSDMFRAWAYEFGYIQAMIQAVTEAD